jgi:hypothetical protein
VVKAGICVVAKAGKADDMLPSFARRCFCGHSLATHANHRGVAGGACGGEKCQCRRFRYIPVRPEEVGEWWLPRRKGFNVGEVSKCVAECICRTPNLCTARVTVLLRVCQLSRVLFWDQWKAKCKCKCASGNHSETPPYRCKTCACGGFRSDFL